MIPVEAPPAGQQNHAMPQDEEATAEEPNGQAEDSFRSQYLMYLLAVMLLGTGFIAWMRNKGKLSAKT
jgi:hypothetical protein